MLCLLASLAVAGPLTAQDVDTEEMLCRDIGDIICLLEEFSKVVDQKASLSAKPPRRDTMLERTVIELQRDRIETRIRVGGGGLPEEVTLYNLNPNINAWFLVRLDWSPQRSEWYHLENTEPQQLQIDVQASFSTGLKLRHRGGETVEDCELWNRAKDYPLRTARLTNAPFVPLCQGKILLRNRIEGYRTTKEWVVEFLRARVWGGETITNIVKETVFKDNFLIKSDPQAAFKLQNPAELAGAPRLPKLNPKFRSTMLPAKEMGIALRDVKDELMEIGRWYPTERQEGVFVSMIEPRAIDEDILKSHRSYVRELDNIEMNAVAYLVAFDTSRFEMKFALGTDHPAVGWSERVLPDVRNNALKGPDGFATTDPLTQTGIIPPHLTERLVGIFTGGFKRDHGAFRWGDLARKNYGSHYGFMEEGVVLSTLQPELASLIVYRDNTFEMKTWTDADLVRMGDMRFVRQNGVAIIEWDEPNKVGIPGRFVSNWTLGNWSGSQDKKFRTLRAGACQLTYKDRRFLIYGYFSSMTPAAMARVFQAYGCEYAMHLDMNALEHTYMTLYAKDKKLDSTPQHLIRGMKVLDERFKGNVPRYIGYPDNRDFFYFIQKRPTP